MGALERSVAREGGRLRLTLAGALRGAEALAGWPPAEALGGLERVELELGELEAEDGAAVASLVDLVRRLSAAALRVELRCAPQMLAHTLYKAGLLRDGRVRLAGEREPEQGYPG